MGARRDASLVLIPGVWGFGGWQLPAVQISVGMLGSCCSLGGRGEGMEGEQQTRDRGVLPAGVRVS